MAQPGPNSCGSRKTGVHADAEPVAATMNMGTLRNVLLVRIASAGLDGITRAGLRGDIAPLVEHRLTQPEWRRCLDELVFVLLAEGLAVTHRMRLTITDSGMAVATHFLGAPLPTRTDWTEVRDVLLVGRALGVEGAPGARRKKLDSAHGLRGAILERSFGVPAAKTKTVTGLRDNLARKVTAKAAGMDASRGAQAPNKTNRARRAVERLLRRPREFASDAALLAELAAEQVGAQQTSVPSLRKAILRKLIGRPAEARATLGAAAPAVHPVPKAAMAAISQALMASPQSPLHHADTQAFSTAVIAAAKACAEGWQGNRRAYVIKVWEALSRAHPHWSLSIDGFKARLIEAHKAGCLTLAYADLRSKDTIELVQASAVRDRNNEWHFIRIDD
jgi:hypothetical protein